MVQHVKTYAAMTSSGIRRCTKRGVIISVKGLNIYKSDKSQSKKA